MGFNDNAKIIRRELLSRICKILLEKESLSNLDRIAIEMRPRKQTHVRCCVYRDRAVIKYKIMAMLGFKESAEEDELKSLGDYYYESINGETKDSQLLDVVNEACSACQKSNYVVTNMCRGCVGRPCMINCPKKAIDLRGGQAVIDHEDCVNCGLCQKVCPFHAIIYAPVPCEDACPVAAIQKDEDGKESIDMDKCILCGKCMESCPFGAIVEKTHLFEVIESTKNNIKTLAMVAPSIAGQFPDGMDKIVSGLKMLGFDGVYEVALGAEITSQKEAEEFREKAAKNEIMTTSCCPSYVNYINKHLPEQKKYVSETLSPMEYTAIHLRKEFPDAKLVFIGPCIAKKDEAMRNKNVDYVLNFEELGAWLIASEIELSDCIPEELDNSISFHARNFAVAGGVSASVAQHLRDVDFRIIKFDGIDKTFGRKLKPVLKEKGPALIEVMSCENGCVGGCSTLVNQKLAARKLNSFIESTKLINCNK